MKRTPYLLFLGLAFATAVVSCKKDQTDIPLSVEGLKVFAGKNRAKIEFEVPAGTKSGKVFYGTGKFIEFAVTDGGNPQNMIVEELPEDEQILRVVTLNVDGTASDPRGIKVKVYGSKYESTLKPRKWVDQINHSSNAIEFLFDGALPGETGVNIVFTNTSGAKDSVVMTSAQNSILVNNINTEKLYYYYSVYKPEADAIDSFNSPSLDLKTVLMLDFKKDKWEIAGVSDAEVGKEAALLIDNNINTAWHSTSAPGFPHWVTVDMGTPKLIDGFYYVNYQGTGKAAKNIRFEISDDNATWTTALEALVEDVYLRQRLPIGHTVTGRYIRVTVQDSWGPTATRTQFAEIDVYNVQNLSGENGKDAFTTSTAVALVNAKSPFQGDNSNPFPTLGDYRLQKMAGWTHNASAVATFDNGDKSFRVFSAAAWGLADVTNGKVYQTVSLQPGYYRLKFEVGSAEGPVDMYGVVAAPASFPDYNVVPSSDATMKYVNLSANENKNMETIFSVTTASQVAIGIVYNTHDRYGATGLPWTNFTMRGFELSKID